MTTSFNRPDTTPGRSDPTHGYHRPLPTAAAFATIYLAWGSTYLAIAVMVDDMPALLGSGTRAMTAGLLLAVGVTAVRGGGHLRVTHRELAGCVVMALLLPVAGQGLVTVAEDGGAPSGRTALVVAAVPLWVTGLRMLSGDRPPVRSFLGVLLGLAGVAGLVLSAVDTGGAPIGSLLLVVTASLAWACGSWLQPVLALPEDPFVVVAYEMVIGGAVLSLLAIAHDERLEPTGYPTETWLAWGFLVVVGSLAAFVAYTWLLRTVSVSLVATYAYVNPVVAVGLGWLVLHEPVDVTTLAGAAVVVVAVALVVRAERQGRS